MYVPSSRLVRSPWRHVLCAVTLGAGLFGCDKATDPAPVALDELKFAFGLKVVDQGNGAVRLKWTGVNNEEDFSGYNIYGVKEDASITALEGKAIKLLDDTGEVDATGKATLSKMGYNGTNWESVGAATNADGDFAVYPYYTKSKNSEDAILPSCLPESGTPSTDGVECKALTTEGSTGAINGQTYFDVSGLKVGSTYCFTVLATLKSGKKAAPATSEVRCVVPRASYTPSASLLGESGKHLPINLAALRTSCGTTGGASCQAISTELITPGNTNCDGTQSMCVNYFNSTLYFTASSYSGIQDLGYYASGFSDPTLPKVPKIKLDPLNTIQNLDGYSLKGQSLPIEKNHIYAVADGERASPTSFYYHLIYVKSLSGNTAAVELRVANKADTP